MHRAQRQRDRLQGYSETYRKRGSGPRRRIGPLPRALVAALFAVSAGVALTGCAAGGNAATGPAEASEPRGALSPDADETQKLLAGLARVDERLDDPESIDVARDLCTELQKGVDSAEVKARIEERFSTGGVQVNKTQAGRILTLIEGTFCY